MLFFLSIPNFIPSHTNFQFLNSSQIVFHTLLALILDWVPPSWLEMLFPSGNSLMLLILRKWLEASLSPAALAASPACRLLLRSIKKLQQDTKLLWYFYTHPECRRWKDVPAPTQFSCLDCNYSCLCYCIPCTHLHVVFIPLSRYQMQSLFPIALSCSIKLSSSNPQMLFTVFSNSTLKLEGLWVGDLFFWCCCIFTLFFFPLLLYFLRNFFSMCNKSMLEP